MRQLETTELSWQQTVWVWEYRSQRAERQLEPGPGFYQEGEVKKTRNKGRMALIVQAAWKITWL